MNIIICFLTLNLCFLFLYLRITRKIYVIDLCSIDVFVYHDMFIYIFCITFLVLLVLAMSVLYKKYREIYHIGPSTFMLKLSLFYDKVNLFYKTYSIIFDYIGPMYTRHLVAIAKNFIDLPIFQYYILIIVFVVVPRFLIILILCLEIYSGQLHYYFYSLLLLLIPMFFKFFIFILKDIGPRLLPEFQNMLITDMGKDTVIPTASGLKTVKAIEIRFKPEITDLDLDFFLFNFYYPMLHIEGHMVVRFLPIYAKISLVTIFTYLCCLLFCWIYILYFYF